MRHAKNAAVALVALVAAVGLASCGGSDSSDAISGQFELLPNAPSSYEALSGEATLERSAGGTTTSLDVSGLVPNAEYIAHLHSGGCDQTDPGGPHFKFDPNGSDQPPNEIHLEFSSNGDGEGRAKVSSDREVPVGEAGSIVLHQAPGEGEGMASAEASEGEIVMVHAGHSHDEASQPEAIACGELEGGSSTAAAAGEGEGGVPTLVIRDGEPVGGIKELEYSAGEEIRFRVESDVADEVHVHGYDLMQDVPAGGAVSFDFPADLEGIFEVELEGRKEQIMELRVNP